MPLSNRLVSEEHYHIKVSVRAESPGDYMFVGHDSHTTSIKVIIKILF